MTTPPVARSGGEPKVQAAEKAFLEAQEAYFKAMSLANEALEDSEEKWEAYRKAIKESEK